MNLRRCVMPRAVMPTPNANKDIIVFRLLTLPNMDCIHCIMFSPPIFRICSYCANEFYYAHESQFFTHGNVIGTRPPFFDVTSI